MSASGSGTFPSSQHIAALDGWRGLAVTVVLLGHFGLEGVLPGFSSFGVDLFFVLSGRLMADILLVKRMPLPLFFSRRFSRVYPALLVFTMIAGLSFNTLQPGYTLLSGIYALTFTLNYAVAVDWPFTMFDHIWSLCVEEHSYILLGLIAFLSRSLHPKIVAAVILLIGFAAMANGIIQLDILPHDNELRILWRTDVAMAAIFLSAGIFMLFPVNKSGLLLSWLTPACLLAAAVARIWGADALISFGCEIFLLAFAAAGIEHSAIWFRSVLESRTFRSIGLCSFSLYLWQEPFYKFAVLNAFPRPIMVAVALVCGILSYVVIERPTRSFLNAMFVRRLDGYHVFRKSSVSP